MRAASAWTQLLNLVDTDFDKCKIFGSSPTADALRFPLEQSRFNFDFLAHAQQALEDNIYLIEGRGCRSWPGQNRFPPGTAGEELVYSLLMDHRYLIGRSTELSRRCDTVSQILADVIEVIEARKSLIQDGENQQIDYVGIHIRSNVLHIHILRNECKPVRKQPAPYGSTHHRTHNFGTPMAKSICKLLQEAGSMKEGTPSEDHCNRQLNHLCRVDSVLGSSFIDKNT